MTKAGVIGPALEIVRVPMPGEKLSEVVNLPVDHLSVVLGACVVAGPEDAHDDLDRAALARQEIEVLVDDMDLLTAPVREVLCRVEDAVALRSMGVDPFVVTPREGGIEIVVSRTSAPRMKPKEKKPKEKKPRDPNAKASRVKDWTRWEVWIYVAR